MNGWWWNPAEPGRGFFIEQREGLACVACCGYGDDGASLWHAVGPVAAGRDSIAGASARGLPGAGAQDAGVSLPFKLSFTGPHGALLDWAGVRIALEPQHRALTAHLHTPGDLTALWIEQSDTPGFALACEDLGGRLFAILLGPEGWLLLEALREGEGRYAGQWWRFREGQALGAPHRVPAGVSLPQPAEVTCGADGTLHVRMPEGVVKTFGRVLRRRARRRLEVHVRVPTGSPAASGLVPITFEICGGGAVTESTYRLTLESATPGPVRHEKALQIGPWTRRLTLLLNSHLLPDGKLQLKASLEKDGKAVWRSSFHVTTRNKGPLAETVRESLRRGGTPVLLEDFADSTHFDIHNRALQPWFERPGAAGHLAGLREAGRISDEEALALRRFADEGYIVLPVAIEEPLLRRIDGELSHAIAHKVDGYEFGSSQRIRNLHQRYPGIAALWRHPAVMRYLELIFGVPARPCQTLTYVFGSQQEAHQDTVHLTPFPAGYMCGVWVALEDVQPNSGELQVFPGTHRLPRIYMHDAGCPKVVGDNWKEFGEKVVARYRRMLDEGGFAPTTYRPKRGTVLIWHENLLHGGSTRMDTSLTRRSIVSHYFADGAIAFYDSTGLAGNME